MEEDLDDLDLLEEGEDLMPHVNYGGEGIPEAMELPYILMDRSSMSSMERIAMRSWATVISMA